MHSNGSPVPASGLYASLEDSVDETFLGKDLVAGRYVMGGAPPDRLVVRSPRQATQVSPGSHDSLSADCHKFLHQASPLPHLPCPTGDEQRSRALLSMVPGLTNHHFNPSPRDNGDGLGRHTNPPGYNRVDFRRQNASRVVRGPYYGIPTHHNHVDIHRIREGTDVRTTASHFKQIV